MENPFKVKKTSTSGFPTPKNSSFNGQKVKFAQPIVLYKDGSPTVQNTVSRDRIQTSPRSQHSIIENILNTYHKGKLAMGQAAKQGVERKKLDAIYKSIPDDSSKNSDSQNFFGNSI
jgi:hypothetical protein